MSGAPEVPKAYQKVKAVERGRCRPGQVPDADADDLQALDERRKTAVGLSQAMISMVMKHKSSDQGFIDAMRNVDFGDWLEADIAAAGRGELPAASLVPSVVTAEQAAMIGELLRASGKWAWNSDPETRILEMAQVFEPVQLLDPIQIPDPIQILDSIQIPEILLRPPWSDPKAKRPKPIVVEGLTASADVEVVWLPGERDRWLGRGAGWEPSGGWAAIAEQVAEWRTRPPQSDDPLQPLEQLGRPALELTAAERSGRSLERFQKIVLDVSEIAALEPRGWSSGPVGDPPVWSRFLRPLDDDRSMIVDISPGLRGGVAAGSGYQKIERVWLSVAGEHASHELHSVPLSELGAVPASEILRDLTEVTGR